MELSAERYRYSGVVLMNQLLYELNHQLIATMVKLHLHLATLEVSTIRLCYVVELSAGSAVLSHLAEPTVAWVLLIV